MARRGRWANRNATRAASSTIRTPTPQVNEASDDEMQDVQASGVATPQEDDGDDQEEEELLEDGDEDAPTTPVNDSEAPSRTATPVRGRGSARRRAGRPPKNRTHDWDAPDEPDSRDGGSDVGTPKRRGGWRGGRGFGGGRWGKPRGGPSHVSQVPLDKEGNMANVVDDEVELPEDPEGELKVDKDGHLKDGREYRVRVFTIQGKGDRLYMLSTEPARCIGFRDSYLFFQKHRQLFKIILPEDAKRDLIERNLIPHSYKGRAIGVVTARSVYREFGARIIIGGKKVTDDYQTAAARANGDVEGELAVPDDRLPSIGQGYDKNRYVAWHGASSVYHSGVPTVPMPNGKLPEGKKRKVHVTGANWMFEHAREASRFNSTLTAARAANLNGVYDIHTNQTHYPRNMQPTHCRWEAVDPSSPPTPSLSTANSASSTTSEPHALANGTTHHASPPSQPPTSPKSSTFPTPNPAILSSFLVADTYYLRPPISNLGVPGPDGSAYDIGLKGLSEVTDEVVACLPEECRASFLETRALEQTWRAEFGTETDDGRRAHIKVSYNNWTP
ncbi:hypothetical protein MMC11_000086 [Xylographa trunciseda]|nr:hypothetical protein [Xylographa trunciseda]